MHIDEILTLVDKCKLEYDESFNNDNRQAIADNYNGCGPDWMPEFARDILTYLYERYEPAFCIHDWDWIALEKTEDNFHLSNERMKNNMYKIAEYVYKEGFLSDALRASDETQIYLLYTACEEFGKGAFFND